MESPHFFWPQTLGAKLFLQMRYIFTVLLVSCTLLLSAQSDKQKEKAQKIGMEAIQLMDEGNYKKSITLLFKAIKLDPDRFAYRYEIGYALYSSELYDETIEWLKPLASHPDVSDVLFQLLGNSYDEIDSPDSAIYAYQLGLEKFPNSGKLHLEPGIVEYRRENYDKAIEYWENGVRAEPDYSSNYFWLGRTLSDSNLKIWSLIYGELFMTLEPATNRSQEMSEILYNVSLMSGKP